MSPLPTINWVRFPEQPTVPGSYVVAYYVHVRHLEWAWIADEHTPHLYFEEHFDPTEGPMCTRRPGHILYAWAELSTSGFPASVYHILPVPDATVDLGCDLFCVLRTTPDGKRTVRTMQKHGNAPLSVGQLDAEPVYRDFVARWKAGAIETHHIPEALRYTPRYPV